ncbi:glycoside hydrolase family 99-like domain-containing protein [Novilysobacter luteus]|nr:glycoside hydrolase family 99-like domain-containing protein [Lysobacter luteus]
MTAPKELPATLVAFYLPQFHTIPENDKWWGAGFTEWRNVTRALPQFEGHKQPRLPRDLGFYDLNNPRVLHQQTKLAQQYGVGAFCMYFYWFGGKRLLERPHRQWLEEKEITLPMCLCWANENWTRTWDGRSQDILIEQDHSPEDDIHFISYIAKYLRDPRYLRVDGKPLLLVYRPGLLPDPKATCARWRKWCLDNDVGEVCIGYVQSFERPDPRAIGFDVAIEFPPNLSAPTNVTHRQSLLNPRFEGEALDWRDVANEYSGRALPDYRLFPGVNCGWDNEARRPGRGRSYLHASPRVFGAWLEKTINDRMADIPASSRFIFINAWNEWAESAVMEPDMRHGHAFLDATRRAIQPRLLRPPPLQPRVCVVIHAWYPDVLEDILLRLTKLSYELHIIISTTAEKLSSVETSVKAHGLNADYRIYENRGRDILPFLRIVNDSLSNKDSLILKLHTKISPHRTDGGQWRNKILDSLLEPSNFADCLKALQDDATLGLISPDGQLHTLASFWGDNRETVSKIAMQIGLRDDEVNLGAMDFVTGSMFWVRNTALYPLLDLDFDEDDFECEDSQVDGTLAHAVERLFAISARQAGYRIGTVSSPDVRS